MKHPVQRMRRMRRAFATLEEELRMMAERFHLDRNQGIFEWRTRRSPPKSGQGFYL